MLQFVGVVFVDGFAVFNHYLERLPIDAHLTCYDSYVEEI